MTTRWLKSIAAALLMVVAGSSPAGAKDVIDTLYSSSGDRIILDYTIQQTGGQTTVRFNGVQKKLGSANQKKYKKLDEVAVVIFDRTGSYNDMKFEGMTPSAFMLPAGVQYSFSNDGYFLLQDNPQLAFTAPSEAQLSIPIFLAHYEKKRHYKIFSQCNPLQFSTKVKSGGGGGRSNGSARQSGGGDRSGDHAANADDIITTEELLDDGLTASDDALITLANVKNTLDGVTKLPFPEDLTFQANHLRELRSKISDLEILQQINDLLAAYDKKKAELEESAAGEQAAAAAAAQQAAQGQAAAQAARQDSIQAAQEQKAADDKKDMMWLIGGIAGLGMLLMAGKQIFQTIKNNKMQKMMMDNIKKAQEQALGNVKIPGLDDNPLTKDVNAQLQREARKKMNAGSDAAMEQLKALQKGNTAAGAASPSDGPSPASPTQPTAPAASAQPGATAQPATPGKRRLRTASEVRAAAGVDSTSPGITITPGAAKARPSSLNDAIPAKYKRWRKPGTDSPTNNNTK